MFKSILGTKSGFTVLLCLLLVSHGSWAQEGPQVRTGKGLVWSAAEGSWSVQADGLGLTWQTGAGADRTLMTLGWLPQTETTETLQVRDRLMRVGEGLSQAVQAREEGALITLLVEHGEGCLQLPLQTKHVPFPEGDTLLWPGPGTGMRLVPRAFGNAGPIPVALDFLQDLSGQGNHHLQVCAEGLEGGGRIDLKLKPANPSASGTSPMMAEDCTNGTDDDMDTFVDCDDPDCQAVDNDNDGVLLCAPDCDDFNDSVWSVPSAITDLALAADGTISWSAPGNGGGNTIVYDLIRSTDPADFSTGTCIELDDTDLTATDTSSPPAGQLFSYLLRTQNACPEQSLGSDSSGSARISSTCQEDCTLAGDDDGDGDADCADFDCIGDSTCAEVCNDGFDNDGDGATDCDDSDCAAEPACLVCDLDGIHEVINGEECDDGGLCDQDGCASAGCDRESTVIINSLQINSIGGGFDLDNADGDNNIYTGIDNYLGSNTLFTDQVNLQITDSINDGTMRGAMTLTGLDSFTDDADVSASMHTPVDPDCPSAPVYSAAAPPPWIGSPPAQMYSDINEFPACVPQATVTEADNAANGIYPTASALQPPAPFIHLQSDLVSLGGFELHRGIMEATVINDGSFVTGLSNGIGGGVLPAEDLWAIPSGMPLCPTNLHVVLAFIGQPDMDLDPAPGGQDTLQTTQGFFPCVLGAVTIDSCTDAETGAFIPNSDYDGDGLTADGECVLDPRISDGYSAGFDFSAVEVHIVESRDLLTYCP